MKNGKIFLLLSIVIVMLGGVYLYYIKCNTGTLPSFIDVDKTDKKYIIQKAGRVVESADTLDEALNKASEYKRSIVVNTYNNEWVYSDFKPFMIITDKAIHDFESFIEAVRYAKRNEYEKVYYKDKNTILWDSNTNTEQDIKLDVPLIKQNPELPRGCEVTALCMIMKYAGKDIDKMTLAEKVKKETQPYKKENGRVEAGNPYDGFVGDMYNMNKFGYGVYHGPIFELAKEYLGSRVVDLTGLEFDEVLYILQQGYPIWVITNGTYDSLDDSQFEMWHTPTGIVKITYKLHSVVITGVTSNKIIINDPLGNKNQRVDRAGFQRAWEQMGNQGIVILD